MLYVMNALPGGALSNHSGYFNPISKSEAERMLRDFAWVSAVGHESTAKAISIYFGIEVAFNRISVTLRPGDQILVCALNGPRLEEGRLLSLEEVLERGFSLLFVHITK